MKQTSLSARGRGPARRAGNYSKELYIIIVNKILIGGRVRPATEEKYDFFAFFRKTP
jgi:hypothetical protein